MSYDQALTEAILRYGSIAESTEYKINQLNIYYEGTFDSLLRQVLDVNVRSFTGFNFQEDKK